MARYVIKQVQWNKVSKVKYCGDEGPPAVDEMAWVRIQLCHLLSVWPASYLASLFLSFFIYEMGMIIPEFISLCCCED